MFDKPTGKRPLFPGELQKSGFFTYNQYGRENIKFFFNDKTDNCRIETLKKLLSAIMQKKNRGCRISDTPFVI